MTTLSPFHVKPISHGIYGWRVEDKVSLNWVIVETIWDLVELRCWKIYDFLSCVTKCNFTKDSSRFFFDQLRTFNFVLLNLYPSKIFIIDSQFFTQIVLFKNSDSWKIIQVNEFNRVRYCKERTFHHRNHHQYLVLHSHWSNSTCRNFNQHNVHPMFFHS